ncbi:hypothetical protein ACJW30_04G128100 [Castanea mollissima]
MPSKNKETKKRPGAQRGLRTACHIFKEPYNEESKEERERVKEMVAFKERKKMKEMAAFKDCQNLQNAKTNETCLDGDYHVTLEAELEKFLVPDESTVNLAITMMNDPMLQTDCFGSLNIPAEGSNLL